MSVVASIRGVRDLEDIPEVLWVILGQTAGMAPDRIAALPGGETM
ncbi:hypothetical protein [Methanofollis ethanolicus]|nr:hypothetical protein [Methanofollis ethanolicus]